MASLTSLVNLRPLFQTSSPNISILRNVNLMISRFGFRYAVNRTEFGEREQVKIQGWNRNIVQHCVSPAPIFFTLSRPALPLKKIVLLCLKNISKTPRAGQVQVPITPKYFWWQKALDLFQNFSRKKVFSPKNITRIKFHFLDKQ